MTRAAIYGRLSRYRGAEDPSTSPERQREAGRAYCEAQGWEVVEIVEDLDVSAGEDGLRLDRPGIQRLRALFGSIDRIVFLKIDRLARSVADFSALASEARAAGVDLVSVRDGLDLSTPGGRFVAQILAAFAEMELATITERVRDGKRKAAELGRWPGGTVPYGYRVEGDALVVAEAERDALRKAADGFLSGRSVRSLCRELQEALPPRRGGLWSSRTLRRTLTSARTSDLLGAETTYLIAERLQAGEPSGRTPTRILSGLLRCGACGGPMYATKSSGTMKYRCHRGSAIGACERPAGIVCAGIDQWAEELYLDLHGAAQETVGVRVSDERIARLAQLGGEAARLSEALTALRGADRREALERLEMTEEEIDRLKAQPASGRTILRETGRTYADAWAAADVAGRREILRDWIGPAGLTIGPGRSGVNGFQSERVVDAGRLRA